MGRERKFDGSSLAHSSTQLPLGSQSFFALAPIFARLEWEKLFNCTRTLATQATTRELQFTSVETSPGAQSFYMEISLICKTVNVQEKLISTWKALHQDSNETEVGQLGNALLGLRCLSTGVVAD